MNRRSGKLTTLTLPFLKKLLFVIIPVLASDGRLLVLPVRGRGLDQVVLLLPSSSRRWRQMTPAGRGELCRVTLQVIRLIRIERRGQIQWVMIPWVQWRVTLIRACRTRMGLILVVLILDNWLPSRFPITRRSLILVLTVKFRLPVTVLGRRGRGILVTGNFREHRVRD